MHGPTHSTPIASLLFLTSLLGTTSSFAAGSAISYPFAGVAVGGGTVTLAAQGKNHMLTLSNDFSIHEEPPDPHWRIIDSKGNVFMLQKLKVQNDKINTSITLPPYIKDVAKVQMWCAFAEIVLGEASFPKPIALK